MLLKAQLLCDVTLSVGKYGSCQASGQAILVCFGLLDSDDEGIMSLQNVGNYGAANRGLHPRRLLSAGFTFIASWVHNGHILLWI